MIACLVFLAGASAMAQVGIFQKSVTLDAAEYTNKATAGSATVANGVYTLKGNGRDVWDNGDEAFFVYNELAGSNTISAKVKWIDAKGDSNGGSSWAKIGVMVREKGDSPESKHYWIEMRCGDGNPALGDQTDAQWRDVEKQASGNSQIYLPDGKTNIASKDGVWLRVTRNAATDTLTSEYSLDGVKWVFANSRTIAMQDVVSYGIIITSHTSDTQMVTAEASDVQLVPAPFDKGVTLDAAAYTHVVTPGSAVENNGVYTLKGNGRDVWDNGDEAFFVYKQLTGPNSISAKVKWIDAKGDAAGGSDWAKIGVMIREKGDVPESKHYWIEMRCGAGSPALGDQTDAQWRDTEGGTSANAQIYLKDGKTNIASKDGVWYKVSRYPGNVFVSEYSLNGNAWTFANTKTIPMADTAAYGLIITSHKEDEILFTAEATDVKFGAPTGVKSSAENWELFH